MYAWNCLHGGVCTKVSARRRLHGSACTEGSARRGLHGGACTEGPARRCLHGGHCTQNVEKHDHDHGRGTGDPCTFLKTRGVPRISLDTLVKKRRTGNGEKIKDYQGLIEFPQERFPVHPALQPTYASSRPSAHIHAQRRFQPAPPPSAIKACYVLELVCVVLSHWLGGRGGDGVTVGHGGVCTEVPARRCLHGRACTEVPARRRLHGSACTERSARRCLHGGACTEGPARKCLHGRPCTEEPARRGLHGGACTEEPARRSLHGGACTEMSARRSLHGGACTEGPARRLSFSGGIVKSTASAHGLFRLK